MKQMTKYMIGAISFICLLSWLTFICLLAISISYAFDFNVIGCFILFSMLSFCYTDQITTCYAWVLEPILKLIVKGELKNEN